jgi:hypothetical protein
MQYLNFDPVVGEKVGVLGHSGAFRIQAVHSAGHIAPPNLQSRSAGITGLGTVDLRLEKSDFVLLGVPWNTLVFDESRPLGRFLDWARREGILHFPEDIKTFDVQSGQRYDGEPEFIVRFHADPNTEPTEEQWAAWSDFSSSVEKEIFARLPLDRWVRVIVRQDEASLHAAS